MVAVGRRPLGASGIHVSELALGSWATNERIPPAAGKLRAWGVLNWKAELIVQAADEAAAQGVPPPCAAQLAYSLVRRSPVEDREIANALDDAHASVVASFTLDGGALTGKYIEAGATGRLASSLGDESHQPALKAAR